MDVWKYVKACDKCQCAKALQVQREKVLSPHDVLEGPWAMISINLIGELPPSNGYNAICIFIDRFSKQIHVVPMTTKLTSEGIAKLYQDHVFHLHGLPRKIIHDRGP